MPANKDQEPMRSDIVQLKPTLTLAAFAEVYVKEVLPPVTQKRTYDRKWKIRKVMGHYRNYLQREPVIADLEKAAILAFVATMKGKPHYQRCFDFLRTLRKQAILAKLLEGEPGKALLSDTDGRGRHGKQGTRPPGGGRVDEAGNQVPRVVLTVEEGSLWQICLKRYFPANINIRSEVTKLRYRYALEALHRFLGRTPMPADLEPDTVVGVMKMLSTEKDGWGKVRSPRTVNETRNRLRALWEWCARRRICEHFPTVGAMPVPKRIPKAWSRDQLVALFAACRRQTGHVAGIHAALWWESLHLVGWDTAERIGALLQARWEHLDFERGVLSLPAEIRKGGSADAAYALHVDTLAMLLRMKGTPGGLIWPWPRSQCSFFLHYKKLLADAGLPGERGAGFHRMRKSVASHLHAGGFNATEALGHSSSAITAKSYLDPSISGQTSPAQLLFRPDEAKAVPPAAIVAPAPISVIDDMEALAWL